MTYLLARIIPCGLLIGGISLGATSCSNPSLPNQGARPTLAEELTILWDKGYIIEEDEAIKSAVRDWQTATGKAVRLSFYNSGEIAPKTLRASKADLPPDILFAAKSVYPISEWRGKLADVTDVVAAEMQELTPSALQAAKIYGAAADSESLGEHERYFAAPLSQSIIPIHYWNDLLAQAGYSPADIPQAWDPFWEFWKTAQHRLQAQGLEIYAIGLPYAQAAQDNYRLFEQVLAAYDVRLLDAQGNLQIHSPEIREGIIRCLSWYAAFYEQGYTPPTATDWSDPDNNRNFLNRQVLMTPNPTLSIPAAIRNDENLYFHQMGTLAWPNKPDGSPLPHLLETRQAIIFADAVHIEDAKDFLRYLIQPEVTNQFLKMSYGRFMPASDILRSDPFWQNPEDPHISTVTSIVLSGHTQPCNRTLNPAYGVVLEENVWGQVLQAMIEDGLSAEAAADEAISQIQRIFDDWS